MPPLVGRDPELATIDRFLRSVPEGYRALVFRGGAGYGKSALLEETVARGRGLGFRRSHRPPGGDRGRASLRRPRRAVRALGTSELDLSAPQARALDVALRRIDADEAHPVDPLALSLAVRAALRELASHDRVLVALDDLQWCDPPSLRTLSFALRRVEAEPVGLVVRASVRSWHRRSGSRRPTVVSSTSRSGRSTRRPLGPWCAVAPPLGFLGPSSGASMWRATGIHFSARRSRGCSPTEGCRTTRQRPFRYPPRLPTRSEDALPSSCPARALSCSRQRRYRVPQWACSWRRTVRRTSRTRSRRRRLRRSSLSNWTESASRIH